MEDQVLLNKQDYINALYVIVGVLWFLTVSAFGFILTMFWSKTKAHDETLKAYGLDIQHLKDVQGIKIDDLKADMKELKQEIREEMTEMSRQIKELSDNVHKQKNQENTLDKTLNMILRHFEEKDK